MPETNDKIITALAELKSGMDVLSERMEHIEERLITRVEKVESQTESNHLQIQGVRDDIHILDKRLSKLDSVVEDIQKNRHSLKNIEQRMVIVEHDQKEEKEAEREFKMLVNERLKAIELALKAESERWAGVNGAFTVLTSKPALVLYGLAVIGALIKYGKVAGV